MNRMKASAPRSRVALLAGVSALLALSACGDHSGANGDQPVSNTTGTEFALYALSRGRGVPAPTRDAFEKASSFLEEARGRGDISSISKTRIGLEGETRLCVKAKDAATARELQRAVRSIADNVELFNVVEEPCSKK